MISDDYGAQKHASRAVPFLEPDEHLLLAAAVQWVQLAKFLKINRNYSEGFLCLTSKRILHIVELANLPAEGGFPSQWGIVSPTMAISIRREGIGRGWYSWVPPIAKIRELNFVHTPAIGRIRELHFAYTPGAALWDEHLAAFTTHVEATTGHAEVSFHAAKGFCGRLLAELAGGRVLAGLDGTLPKPNN